MLTNPVKKPNQFCSPEKLQKIDSYVCDRLNRNLGVRVNDLADYFQISRCHFSRSFKNATGVTPSQYLLRRKIEYSQALLRANQYTKVEIALMLGFFDLPHFCKTFKKVTGVTPGNFV